MNTEQLPLDDNDRLYELGAAQLHDPTDPRDRDLRGQGLTALQIHTMTTIEPIGSYL
jgi:hypothetical protein